MEEGVKERVVRWGGRWSRELEKLWPKTSDVMVCGRFNEDKSASKSKRRRGGEG